MVRGGHLGARPRAPAPPGHPPRTPRARRGPPFPLFFPFPLPLHPPPPPPGLPPAARSPVPYPAQLGHLVHQLLEPLLLRLHLDEALELRVGPPQPAASRRLHAAAATFACRRRPPLPARPRPLPRAPRRPRRHLMAGRQGGRRGGGAGGACRGAAAVYCALRWSWADRGLRGGRRGGRGGGGGEAGPARQYQPPVSGSPPGAHGSSSVMSRMPASSAVNVGRSSAFCGATREPWGPAPPPRASPGPGELRGEGADTYLVPAAVHDGVDPLRGLLRAVEAQALDDVLCCLAVVKPLVRHLSQRVNLPHQHACCGKQGAPQGTGASVPEVGLWRSSLLLGRRHPYP